jgi:hypothetical protein
MRYWAIIAEIFFVEVSFFEVRMDRADFELVRKDTSRNGQIDDVGDSRK